MLHACPACHRTFPEAGFCPFDRSPLVAQSSPAAETQMSMAMPAVTAPGISGQLKTNIEPHRTFPLTPGPVNTQEITSTVGRAAPEAPSSSPPPMRSVSASEHPQEVLDAFRTARDSEYDRLVGQTLDGRYYVQKKIGEGGMGVVFAARHAVIERPLAIKVLKREVMRDTATIQRFVQEARAASRIGHPNIIDVTDFGTTPDGMTYSVMEYVAGQTLGATIRASAPFPTQRAIRIAAQIARALGAAHDKGIVHRDLKPENVFLVDRDNRIDFVKIVDFGIAKVVPIDGKEAGPRLTRAGSVFGTPEYMAPEQAAGRSDNDGRVDIYALGVILYEMLCGRVPHKGDTMVRTLAMQMLDVPEPLSKIAPQANIPRQLEDVVMKALAKKRELRYQTMGDLLAALEHVQATVLPPPVAQSVTGSPVYALAPLPPGADANLTTSSPPVALAMPSPSEPGLPRRSKPVTNQVTTRPKDEPQFVSSDKPHTFEHLYTDELEVPPRRRWPLLLVVALLVGGTVGAVIFALQRRAAVAVVDARDAALVARALEPDALVAPPADAQLEEPVADARARVPGPADASDLVVIADAHVRVIAPRRDAATDTGTGPVMMPDTPTGRGTIIVEVITRPETAHVYVGAAYNGPSGAKLERPLGTRLEVRCQQPGYKPGTASIVFDGKTEYVVCALERIKTCVETLANPFDKCPDAGVP
ncbi:MAG: protein kinase [Proteobacteria bacterium]|nr:protein kinase [Pseudomonadota bacterium]